jgi:hypothetical protein
MLKLFFVFLYLNLQTLADPNLATIRYTQIINNTLQKNGCSAKDQCPNWVRILFDNNKSSSYLGLIKSSQELCKKNEPQHNGDNLSLVKEIESKSLAHLGPQIQTISRICFKDDSKVSAHKISQYSHYNAILEESQLSSLKEINLIGDLLDEKKNTQGFCKTNLFPRIKEQCDNVQNCAKPNDLDDLAYYTSDVLEELKELEKQIEETKIQKANAVRRHYQTEDYKKNKIKLQLLEERKKLKLSQFPWLESEVFKKTFAETKDSKKAIKAHLLETKKQLEQNLYTSQNINRCLNGFASRSCTVGKIEQFLAENTTPTMRSKYKNATTQSEQWFNYQQCLIDTQNESNEKSSTYWRLTFDAGLTLATLGVGSVFTIPKAILSARKLALTKELQAAEYLVNGANIATGLNDTITECFEKTTKLSANTDKKEQQQCEVRDIYFSSKITSQFDNCVMNAAFLMMDGVPLAARQIQKTIQKSKMTEQELKVYESDVVHGKFEKRNPSQETPIKVSTTDPNKLKLINELKEFTPTTTKQNRVWMNSAKKALKNINKKNNPFKFFVVENTFMKKLNDTLKDKDYVTSLTNLHKSILDKKMQAFKTKWEKKGVTINSYSDFKSMRYSFKGDTPADFEKELADIFESTNTEFVSYLKTNKLIREEDAPEKWFRGGLGNSDEQASQQARVARDEPTNTLSNFNNPKTVELLHKKANELQEILDGNTEGKLGLVHRLEKTDIIKSHPDGIKEISTDAIDIFRKNVSDGDAKTELMNRFGLSHLPDETVTELRKYLNAVDDFSPSLHIAERKIASLSENSVGGISADMVGMGSINLNETSLAIQTALKKGKTPESTLNEVLLATRTGEINATKLFRKKQDDFNKIVTTTLGKDRTKVICSGDDCIVELSAAITDSEKNNLVKNIAREGYSGQYRLAFVSDKVKSSELKNQLASQGESFEKSLRKSLAKKMDPAKLKGINFGVDMMTTELNQGPVKLLIGTANSLKLSTSEMNLIKTTFTQTIEELNKELTKKGTSKGYTHFISSFWGSSP